MPFSLRQLRRSQTLRSFDYQWSCLPDGDAMLSDAWFREHVDDILAGELLGVEREWFQGREALDAGCGGGRWTLGLLRLGCRVTAIDASTGALAAVERQMRALVPDEVARGCLTTLQVDLLAPPAELLQRRFDLVFSFGVLHHTGDTQRALRNLAPLVKDEGLLFVYLYGTRSLDPVRRVALLGLRTLLSPLPFSAKVAVLRRLLPGRDPHQAFDTFSPLVNDTYTHEEVERWLHALGFDEVVRTIDYTELYLRARRDARAPLATLPKPQRPYWFERWRRRPLRAGSAPPLP